MKILQVGAVLFHADRRMDGLIDRHDDANSHFLEILRRLIKTWFHGFVIMCGYTFQSSLKLDIKNRYFVHFCM